MTQTITSLQTNLDVVLRDSRRILIASDFDGTLCPIAESPAEVRLAPAMAAVSGASGPPAAFNSP